MDDKKKAAGTDENAAKEQRSVPGRPEEQIGPPAERHGSREGFGQRGNLGEGKTA